MGTPQADVAGMLGSKLVLHLFACFLFFHLYLLLQPRAMITALHCIALHFLLCFLGLLSLALYFRSKFGPVLFGNVTFQKGDLSFTVSVSPVLSTSCVSDPIHCV